MTARRSQTPERRGSLFAFSPPIEVTLSFLLLSNGGVHCQQQEKICVTKAASPLRVTPSLPPRPFCMILAPRFQLRTSRLGSKWREAARSEMPSRNIWRQVYNPSTLQSRLKTKTLLSHSFFFFLEKHFMDIIVVVIPNMSKQDGENPKTVSKATWESLFWGASLWSLHIQKN